MSAGQRRIRLSPRLQAAVDMLEDCPVIADVGCDHGRTAVALLQQGRCECVIATDISAPSLEKARRLAKYVGVDGSIDFRTGDGFAAIKAGECDAVMILGMGGELIAGILDACPLPLMGAGRVVMQPMRGQEELREYLYSHGYWIREDRLVREGRRCYQVLAAEPSKLVQEPPKGWPKDCFEVGFMSFLCRDPLLLDFVAENLQRCERQLAEARGTEGEAVLNARCGRLKTIIKLWEDSYGTK
ncbi:MAG: class I SAM-dependent methyltransferase [Clostridia bacterium]|nr:class I SAM-dependent methyltransferase [Clostridia bacterium]